MASKIWGKQYTSSNWGEIKRIWIKKDPNTIWERARKIWVKASTTGVWKLIFSGGNLPVSSETDPISIRYNSYTGTKVTTPYAFIGGPASDGTDTQSLLPQYYLYGHDGSYTNYTSITNRYYKYAYPTISDVLGSLEGDDILNTKSNMIVAENCYIWYDLTVNNGSDPFDSIQFEAGPLYMIKQNVYANSYPSISGTQAVGNTISMTYNYKNYWYNSPDQSSSYIAWYRSTDGYTLPGVNSDSDVGNPVSIKYFTDSSTNNTTSIQGALSYPITSSDSNYYLVCRTHVENSYTKYFNTPTDYRVVTNGKIGVSPPTNTSLPYYEVIGGSANTTGSIYRFYPGTWNNPASGTTLKYRYHLDKNNAAGTNLFTYPSTTTFSSDTYYDYQFNNTISDTLSFYVLASNGSESLYAWAASSFGPISAPFSPGTISISGGSSSTYSDTQARDVSAGATLTVSTSGWPAGTTFTYQWYKTGSGQQNVGKWGTASSQAVGSSYVGEAVYCQVSYSNPNYPSTGSGYLISDTYVIVPNAPTFVLTNNNNGSFTISSVSSSGAGYYEGSYIYNGNTYTISRTSIGTSSTFSPGSGSVIVNLYGTIYVSSLSTYMKGYEYTSNTVSVTSVQSSGSMRRLTMPIAFTGSSQNIWVATNGYVSTTVDPTTNPGTSWPAAGGVVIGPFVSDDYQLDLYTYSDSSNYYVRWQGKHLSADAGNSVTLDYLMKFYWSSTTVDVYFINNSSAFSSFSGDAIRYGGTSYQTWSNTTSISGMSIPSGMTQVTTAPTAGYDDGRVQITAAKPVAAPSGGSVSISTNTGNYQVGSVITYSTSGWSPTPTSYYLELHNGTNPVLTSDPLRASTTSSSGTYTIQSADVPNYFKAWATVTNSGGSGYAASIQVGPATAAPVTYSVTWNSNGGSPSVSTTGPYNSGTTHYAPSVSRTGYTLNGWYTSSSGGTYRCGAGGSYVPTSSETLYAQWTANATAPATPTGLSITGSGLATWNAVSGATSYTINYWLASNSSGANAFNAGTVNVGNTTSYQIPYATNPSTGVYCNYTDARVLASNSAGDSAWSAWYPSPSTYV